jgi:two-component system, OmpR family, phosphate regulon sensor histidine kinase PhoR
MKPSFGKRLTASYLFVVIVTLLFTGTLLTPRLKKDYLSHLESNLAKEANLIARDAPALIRQAPAAPIAQNHVMPWARLCACRVTLIRADGVVIADSERTASEIAQMDNHMSRPEVQAALRLGLGESKRHSATLQEDMLYVAVPISAFSPSPAHRAGEGGGEGKAVPSSQPSPDTSVGRRSREGAHGVVRLALSLSEVHKQVATFQADLLRAGGGALVVAFLVALLSVRRISRPLRELVELANRVGSGQRPQTPCLDSTDEFGRLAQAFSDMAGRIEQKVGELSRERAELGAILSSLVESIVAMDHQGRLLFLNTAAERLFDVRAHQAKGRPFLEVLRHSPLNEVLGQALSERQPAHKEILLHAPAERVISVNALPVDYGEGQTGVLAALHDVTELRKLENIRREFVANVSHELKTPLTAIQGYVETLLQGAVDDPKTNRDFLRTISEHANNLNQLINDILDLSAIESARVSYRFEPIDIGETLDRILKALTPMAKAKRVSIKIDLPQKLPKVRADREKLGQILLNLIDNAIKFNKPNGHVEISAEEGEGGLLIKVKDTGMGIPGSDLPRIFERFYRVDKSRNRDIPGTGLGLAIVKHLVEAHKGQVSAESNLEEGSTFTFTLPIV